jgi:hypothetical protein
MSKHVRRRTDDLLPRANITSDGGTRAHNGSGAYADSRQYHGTGADERILSNFHFTCHMGTRAHVDAIANDAVMINTRGGIHYDGTSEFRIRAYRRHREYLGTMADRCIRRDEGSRVHDG